MTLDVPLAVKMEEWRRKAAEGSLTMEEMKEVVAAVRAGRVSAAATSAKSRASKEPTDVGALLDELGGM